MDVTIGVTIAVLIIIVALAVGATLVRSRRPGSVMTVTRTRHEDSKSHDHVNPTREETTR